MDHKSLNFIRITYRYLLGILIIITSISAPKAQKKSDSLKVVLDEIEILERKNKSGITRLRDVEGTEIYAAKKNEVILLNEVDGNFAINNSRQIFAKIPGVNIWESDAAGVQLGIAARGLSPNRTAEFNTRQNGSDMSADAIGYPESYYSPPTDALEKIQVVRGAASLQYGSQFGGMVNFQLKKGVKNKPFEFFIKNTVGRYGFFSTFNSVGGTVNKTNYYAFYQYKTGNGWRPNTQFNVHTGYVSVSHEFTEKFMVSLNLTSMQYLMQQPGGLTDTEFAQDPTISKRSRNWFSVSWNVANLVFNYKFNARNELNIRNFGFYGSRKSLGNIEKINELDFMQDRTLIWDNYLNFGSEGRFLTRYNLFNKPSTLLLGYRFYKGNTNKMQGLGNNGSAADFKYNKPDHLETFNYQYPGTNVALFSENIFMISDKLSITPGIRWEMIDTQANGYYRSKDTTDLTEYRENKSFPRSFLLLGIGVGYVPFYNTEIYANISQNYRGITFNDMKVSNPNAQVDPNLKDESGFNADLGFRGNWKDIIDFDLSVFYLFYKNRIGNLQKVDNNINIYSYTTNISDSRNVGFEFFGEINLNNLFKRTKYYGTLSIYQSLALIDARYINSPDLTIKNKKVEFAPSLTNRMGLTYKIGKFSSTFQFAFTGYQYADATNAFRSGNAVIGLIPPYWVMDWSANYSLKNFSFSLNVNNLTNNIYFTRRASSYPGPGIIPAEPRMIYFSLGYKL